MEHRVFAGSGPPDGSLVRFAAAKGTPVFTDDGKKLGRVAWFGIEPVAGRIALVMIDASRWGLFSRRQVAVPWGAMIVDDQRGRLVVRTEDGFNAGLGGRFPLAVRRDPARTD